MLKALELIGFKSFADKTRFEFPPGITVIVGPNGSGKSNIVDAIKWVLGEQSAKSLRGKDMADVIFKGSGDGGRKMVNTAEATIVFDNSDGQLARDAPEVHVTRRVYRSGEGEYLINREPCRLRDIRHLFRGTGVGADAYSLIEQGKVDQMLQASPRDRRAIFEEAAGISRFKAKKIEAQRRLERVEQNLLRLADIVEEVESRVRSVRAQAAKARRYREYRDRLQQLRTQVGFTDWRQLTQQLEAMEAKLIQLRNETGELSAQAESLAARSLELEVEFSTTDEAIRLCGSRASHNREQIAARESANEQARTHCRDLGDTATRHRRQLAAMTGRAGDLQRRLCENRDNLAQAEAAYDEVRSRAADRERALSQLTQRLEELRKEGETRRQDYLNLVRSAAAQGNRISSLESQLDGWQASCERARRALDELETAQRLCRDESTTTRRREEELLAQRDTVAAALEAAQRQTSQLRSSRNERRGELASLQQRFSAARERVAVLDELDRNQEGLTSGVREVLELAREATAGPFGDVQGLVADLIQASVDVAPLVDVALGDKAQYIVVEGEGLLDEIQWGGYQPTGRVGLISLDGEFPAPDDASLVDVPGVVGRLDSMVAAAPRLRPLVQRLLGASWCVESLSTALALRATALPGSRFVTLAGELVEGDGSIVVGTRLSMTGLVSRRSELRAQRHEADELERTIQQLQAELESLAHNVQQQDRAVQQLDVELKQVEATLAAQRARGGTLSEQSEQLERQRNALSEELAGAEARQAGTIAELAAAREELARLESQIADSERAFREIERQHAEVESMREQCAGEATAAKIELAKSEQHVEGLRTSQRQGEEDQQEHARALAELQTQLSQCLKRLEQTDREILCAATELAELYLRKESLEREARRLTRQRDSLAALRAQLLDQLQSVRQRIRQLEEKQHQQELAAGEVRHQRSTLADRLREDYEIEIADLEHDLTPEQLAEREPVEREIADLRRKINNIGAVNLEALEELDELENRFTSLSNQYRDLKEAKEALERIIHKINADSRRLFQDTLEAIRANFQTLYRKAFGGGRADLVLEEGIDLLEAGVDIIATPPGKPSFSNSLLSGGEKALTAVSLLLAVFQYRPSPFCVLDEVDAPFDEANIGRFIEVLKGFLGWTKFVIVTHSKKTMTAATTLYGVTMQESGVSKRVSVRFEDVTEDGHILPEAIERESAGQPDEERGAA